MSSVVFSFASLFFFLGPLCAGYLVDHNTTSREALEHRFLREAVPRLPELAPFSCTDAVKCLVACVEKLIREAGLALFSNGPFSVSLLVSLMPY